MAAAVIEGQLKSAVAAYKEYQEAKTKLVTTRTQLQSQINENEMVLEELTRLNDDSNVFKMIGPALIKQDLVEAKSNVNKRVEYIKGEIGRLDLQLKGLESKSKDRENEVGEKPMHFLFVVHGLSMKSLMMFWIKFQFADYEASTAASVLERSAKLRQQG